MGGSLPLIGDVFGAGDSALASGVIQGWARVMAVMGPLEFELNEGLWPEKSYGKAWNGKSSSSLSLLRQVWALWKEGNEELFA